MALRQRALSDEGPMLETLDYTIRIDSIHRSFYFSISISTLPTQHNTFMLAVTPRKFLQSKPNVGFNTVVITEDILIVRVK